MVPVGGIGGGDGDGDVSVSVEREMGFVSSSAPLFTALLACTSGHGGWRSPLGTLCCPWPRTQPLVPSLRPAQQWNTMAQDHLPSGLSLPPRRVWGVLQLHLPHSPPQLER